MTRLAAILILLAFTLRCPAPVTLPPVGFDAGNWSAIATALNNQQTNPPTIGSDQGGLHYIGTMNNGFSCTAVASNQFATAQHVFPGSGGTANLGTVTFGGATHNVTSRSNWNDFGILTIDGTVTNWTRINTNELTFRVNVIAWGIGQGYKVSDTPYSSGPQTVFPVHDETRAMRWGRRSLQGITSGQLYAIVAQGDTNRNAAIVGGDSGGAVFLLNTNTSLHELIGVHSSVSSFVDNYPTTSSYGYHASAYSERDGITAYLNHGDPTTNALAATGRAINVGTLIFGR